ncbi:DUF4190 domain-containing protein [Arthrobacter sp. ISL-48]|uniref:DUF4190 domain-containing protein n=1 Tax=Arthrobacter sp. ISL-48 TaxID=2819110 RepID=UPI001BE8D31F|nr:DUF4190 domain-containing protein [Arthrobacter sp. ISL-48]MBT2534061.1 DUF4190 domain-containing protein [Arthrobacter sp. ISL-48]
MTDQPTQRPDPEGPDGQGLGETPAGYQPPQFVPPQGSEIPAPPAYEHGQQYGGQDQYGQPGGQYGQDQYGQPGGQYGAPYAQPGSPYAQPGSPYGQPAGAYGQPPSPYGQPAYYGMPAEPKGLSIASMVCGIASVILGWFLLPQIAAIITGHLALRREPSGKGMSITGLVLGYLCLLGYGAFWVFVIVAAAMYGTSSSYSY